VGVGWRACWWFLIPGSVAVALALWRLVPPSVHADEVPETAGLRQRVVAAAAVVAAMTFVVMIGAFFIAQQYLQQAVGYSALGAAAALTVIAVLVAIAAPFAGRLADARGERPVAALGFVLVAGGLGLLAIPGAPLDGLQALPPLVPFGLGLGLLFVPASRAALNAVPQARHGRVSSLLSVSRLGGATLGSMLAGSALSAGVTSGAVHAAMLVGALLSLVIGIPAALKLSPRRARGATQQPD
jgi:DHA2 family multidrug resistance protein-like MFS transporter